ncbi:MAG: hypothetical protein C4288_19240 [Leptolyngbya sp. ERB_1_1]
MTDKITQTIAAGLAGMTLMIAGAGCSSTQSNTAQQPTPPQQTTPPQQPNTAQRLSCTGTKMNGWNYDAKFADGRFTQITWTRAGQPTHVSQLTFDRKNDQGQPIYRGSFQGATAISLVDLGQGNVRPGSQVSVGTEEWGWARGTCAIATASGASSKN